MTKSLLCLAILAASFATSAQAADAPAVATNLSLTSSYKYRGQDQSLNKPAVQGGFDYAHSSGFYVGNWNSSVSGAVAKTGLEMDLYGGYKGEITKGLGFDLGMLRYQYIDSATANTTELYGAMSYGPVIGKLSYTVSKGYFGFAEGQGTIYADASLNQPLTKALTLNAHLGATILPSDAKNAAAAASKYLANFFDYKLGLTYDLGAGFSAAAAVVGASRDGATEYGTGNKPRLIATITKSM